MRLTPKQVYDKLLNEDKILTLEGQIRFELGNVNIIVKQRDVVGNIIQEWLEGWFKENKIDYATEEKSFFAIILFYENYLRLKLWLIQLDLLIYLLA